MPNELTTANYKAKAKEYIAKQESAVYSLSMSLATVSGSILLSTYGIFNGRPLGSYLSPYLDDPDAQESHSPLTLAGVTICSIAALLVLKSIHKNVQKYPKDSQEHLSDNTIDTLLNTTPSQESTIKLSLALAERNTNFLESHASTLLPVRFFNHFNNTKLATSFFGPVGGIVAATGAIAVEIADIVYTANKM